MALNFYDYDGLQPKTTPPKLISRQCMVELGILLLDTYRCGQTTYLISLIHFLHYQLNLIRVKAWNCKMWLTARIKKRCISWKQQSHCGFSHSSYDGHKYHPIPSLPRPIRVKGWNYKMWLPASIKKRCIFWKQQNHGGFSHSLATHNGHKYTSLPRLIRVKAWNYKMWLPACIKKRCISWKQRSHGGFSHSSSTHDGHKYQPNPFAPQSTPLAAYTHQAV